MDNRAKWEQKVMLKNQIMDHEIYLTFEHFRPYHAK